MSFRVSKHQPALPKPQVGTCRLWQSTALIGATLLFCLAGVGAGAQTLYYNHGRDGVAAGAAPDPLTGGNWSSITDDDNWVSRTPGGFAASNTDFDARDDVLFLSEGSPLIAIEIDGTLQPEGITVEDGNFAFRDANGPAGRIIGDLLTIDADGSLTSDADMMIAGAVTVEGELAIGAGATLTASSGVSVTGGRLAVGGRVDGDVTLDAGSALDLGAASLIDGRLTFNGTTFNGAGHVGEMTVNGGSTVTFGGAAARVDGAIANSGSLTLGQGRFEGSLTNNGTGVTTLVDDVTFGIARETGRGIANYEGGVIAARGGSRTLGATGIFNNSGRLDGSGAGNALIVEVGSINLLATSQITGNVTLSGDITNSSDLDMVHVPVLQGTFTNQPAGSATVSRDVDGNGHVFQNRGTLTVNGGNLTGLASLTNDGTITVSAGRTLGAGTINHRAGTMTSSGRLAGAVITSATASIRGEITGSLKITGTTTTITGALDMSGTANGGRIDVGTAGTLTILETMRVTTATLSNQGVTHLGTDAFATIDGNVVNSGRITGIGTITGNLTFAGGSGSAYTGSMLIVTGALTNDLDRAAAVSDFGGITYGSLRNLADLTIDQAVTTDVNNAASGTLTVNAAIGGGLFSRGQTRLNSNVAGQLQVQDGVTTVGATAAGDPVVVGGPDAPQLVVGAAGALQVSAGDLRSTGTVLAAGQISVARGRTLTTPRLILVAGTSAATSVIGGTLAGEITVQAGGALTLDGAIVTERLTNAGDLRGATLANRASELRNGLINSGTVTMTSTANPVSITGLLDNRAGATATIIGNVIAGGGLAGDVTNAGNLTFTGEIASSLQNSGTGTVTGRIGGNAVNSGSLNLAADVAQEIRNTGSGAVLNIIGDTQATDLVNSGTVNVRAGQSLDLTSGRLDNAGGATLSLQGAVGTGTLAVQNAIGGTLTVAGSGRIAGNLSNAGNAGLAGRVTGNTVNSDSGQLDLRNGAQLDGTLISRGDTDIVAGAAVAVAGGTTIEAGSVEVQGTLTSAVVNRANGTLDINGGTVIGDVRNDVGGNVVSSGVITGDMSNAGTYIVDGLSRVEGDFTNEGLLTQSSNGSRLVVAGAFVNSGIIRTGAFTNGVFTISAATYETSGVTEGRVLIDANIGNSNLMILRDGSELLGNLDNRDNGIVRVWGTVTGDGDTVIVNDGLVDISDGGDLLNVDTVLNRDRFSIAAGSSLQANSVINAAGSLSNGGRIEADVSNRDGARLISTGILAGDVSNAGEAELQGRVTGDLATTATGLTTVEDDLIVTGQVVNAGDMVVQADARLTAAQSVFNIRGGNLTSLGTIDGNLSNAGNAALSGVITGALQNNGADASATITVGDSLRAGSVINKGGMLLLGANRTLSVDGQMQNIGDGVLSIAGTVNLRSARALLNSSTGGMAMAAGSTLNGNLQNNTDVRLAGTINGSMLNRGSAIGAGTITGDLINQGATFQTSGDLLVEGQVINQRGPAAGSTWRADGPQLGPGDPARLTVGAGTTLTAGEGLSNDRFSTVRVDGTLVGDVINRGQFDLNQRLRGSLDSFGTARLQGEISGDVTLRAGSGGTLTGDLTVGGVFDSFADITVGRDDTLTAKQYVNRENRQLTVNGRVQGQVWNLGGLVAGSGAEIENLLNQGSVSIDSNLTVHGTLTNNGRVDLVDGTTDDLLRVNGRLGGVGVYALDLDVAANDGAGASDRVVVRGGAVTGSIFLDFDSSELATPSDESKRILVFDVDGSQGLANDFTYDASGLPLASERIIYAVRRDLNSGDLYVTDEINPALGALAGNLALTQSLIGAVVNRPTSPFVPGLATDAGAQKCGFGAWARAVAGHASATGKSSSASTTIDSEIEADYRGLQFGGDLACFESSVNGWNAAFGILGGINDGSTTQPVYINNPSDPSNLTNMLGSITRGDFRQYYAGVYATASHDRLSLDLQVRRERTSFTMDNDPIGANSVGLSLNDAEFNSKATTVSGSISYAYQLPRESWTFLPTAGFAFTNLSADEIKFSSTDTDDTLQIEDSQNRVGFIGGTLSKTFVQPERNSAVYVFGTATVYKDFADDTQSIYTMARENGSIMRTESLSSTNLGTYGELSLGANYLRVLETGRANAPRQFNASIRVDGRTGDVLDSYGVTAQIRYQF